MYTTHRKYSLAVTILATLKRIYSIYLAVKNPLPIPPNTPTSGGNNKRQSYLLQHISLPQSETKVASLGTGGEQNGT